MKKKKKKDLKESKYLRLKLQIIWVPEKENQSKRTEWILKTIIQEKFPKVEKELKLHIERAHFVPENINPEWPRDILIKLLEGKKERMRETERKERRDVWAPRKKEHLTHKERKLDYHQTSKKEHLCQKKRE